MDRGCARRYRHQAGAAARKPRAISDANLDGLYFYQDSLVGIQNPDVHPGRVMRYYLSPDRNAITRAEVREAYNPSLTFPQLARWSVILSFCRQPTV